MTLRESNPNRSEPFLINPKTPIEQLEKWARERWNSNGKRGVASDMVSNCKELLAGRESIDHFDAALNSIKHAVGTIGNPQTGLSAFAQAYGSVVGGIAAGAKWDMDSPQAVYLSARCFASKLSSSSRWESFRENLEEVATSYAEKTLPDPKLYIEILTFLLDSKNRSHGKRNLILKITSLLKDDNIQTAYNLMKQSSDNSVGGRGRR